MKHKHRSALAVLLTTALALAAAACCPEGQERICSETGICACGEVCTPNSNEKPCPDKKTCQGYAIDTAEGVCVEECWDIEGCEPAGGASPGSATPSAGSSTPSAGPQASCTDMTSCVSITTTFPDNGYCKQSNQGQQTLLPVFHNSCAQAVTCRACASGNAADCRTDVIVANGLKGVLGTSFVWCDATAVTYSCILSGQPSTCF